MVEAFAREPQKEVPTTSDPQAFMEGFTASGEYAEAFDAFYAGKNLSPQVTEDMKRRVFLEKEAARIALIRFAQKRLHFTYDPTQFPEEVRESADFYEDAAAKLKSARASGDRDAYANQDALRSAAHSTFADTLMKAGIVPTQTLGLGMAGLILLSRGHQNYEALLVDRSKITQSLYKK